MSLADVIRNAVKIAHDITLAGELQETVTLQRWNGKDDFGQVTYAASISVPAVVSHSARRIRLDTGLEIAASATVSFLKPIPALSPTVTGREEPIDKRDKITLPTGRSGPILRTDGGVTDPDTARPYLVTCYLG